MQTNYDLRWPKLTSSPVLDSVRPVIEGSRDVRTDVDKIVEVAGWMAYEELPMPDYTVPFGVGTGDVRESIDYILTTSCIDTAFTDFSSRVKFQVEHAGQQWSDSDALFAFHEKAGRSQEDSFCFSLDKVFSPAELPLTPCFHPHSR
ncbi:MAG: hypothetical protein WBW53_03145 [Terriglobales bacterium]